MTLTVVAYVLMISTALSVVAVVSDRACGALAIPRRLVWIIAMAASTLLPAAMLAVRHGVPVEGVPAMLVESVSGVAPRSDSRAPAHWPQQNEVAYASAGESATPSGPLDVGARAPAASWRPRLPEVSSGALIACWGATSTALLLLLGAATVLLQRRATHWPPARVLDRVVLVSQDTGPALVGVIRPRIVVPRWFVGEPAATQRLILSHEAEHARSHDPLLLRGALVLAFLVPWNLLLWWQWKRLRLAIELDCDVRVLRSGTQRQTYAAVLLDVARRASAVPLGVIGMTEPASTLERRIRQLLAGPRRLGVPGAIATVVTALTAIAIVNALDVPRVTRNASPASSSAMPAQASVAGEAAARGDPTPAPGASPAPMVPDTRATASSDSVANNEADGARRDDAQRAVRASATWRLPPPAEWPGLPQEFLSALAATHPELTNGATRADTVAAAVVLRPDSSVHISEVLVPEPPNVLLGSTSALIPPDVPSATTTIRLGTAVPGGGTFTTNVYLRYAYLPEHYSAAHTAGQVRQAALAAHADLLRPATDAQMHVLTVYMTGAGTIDRMYSELLPRATALAGGEPDAARWIPMFEPLGVVPTELGTLGATLARADPQDMGSASMLVRYAFPPREGEPAGGFARAMAKAAQLRRDQFRATALAIVNHYLPDAFHGSDRNAGTATIGFSRAGEVLFATRLPILTDGPAGLAGRQARNRLSRFMVTQLTNAEGVTRPVTLGWE